MTHSHRRLIRIACKLLLLICLPLSGVFWAWSSYHQMMTYAVLLTAASGVAAFIAEILVSSTENGIDQLEQQIKADKQRHADELAKRDEEVRQLDRIVAVLHGQNHDMRAKLITLSVRKQRATEADQSADEEDV